MTTFYERVSVWQKKNHDEIQTFAEGYKAFLDRAKTERLAHDEILAQAQAQGFRDLAELQEAKQLTPGAKVYFSNRNKSIILAVLGQDLEDGLNIIASHIDSPRLDLKQVPLYEEGNYAFCKTHYYGGVKKYHWVTLPLAIHGVIFNKQGEKINISIGEDPQDPVLFINDLLIHLAADQMKKTASEVVGAEQLNVIVGSIPLADAEKDAIKSNVLKLLQDKYGIIEEDFLVAELELVPAGKSRDVGLDRSLISGHGHDDRSCAYTSLQAIFQVDQPETTALAIFVDKEEIGSVGNASLGAMFLENFLSEILASQGKDSSLGRRRALYKSHVLSADVSACYDPNFPEVSEKMNSAFLGCGASLNKYTGARGKSGSNDANAEFLAKLRLLFDQEGVIWQTAELGKTDQGGGGTVAYLLAKYGAEVVDLGLPVPSMHAPLELVSKADLFAAYEAYKAFLCKF